MVDIDDPLPSSTMTTFSGMEVIEVYEPIAFIPNWEKRWVQSNSTIRY